MFTCTLVRSQPESKKTLGETWAPFIKAINNTLWTSVASRCSLTRMGAEQGSVYGQKGTIKDVLARCLKKADVQVCTLTSVYILFCNCNIHALAIVHTYLLMTNNCRPLTCTSLWLYYNRCLFFRRLKINHEPYEFILDPGTVANSCYLNCEPTWIPSWPPAHQNHNGFGMAVLNCM